MAGLCFAGGRVRGPDGHFFQTGCPGCGFRAGHGHPGGLHPAPHLGHEPVCRYLARGAPDRLCYFKALQLGDVSRVAPLDKLSVPLAMLLGVLVLGEPCDPKTVAGGILITAGALLLVL